MTSLDSLNDATASPRLSALHMNKYPSPFNQISMRHHTRIPIITTILRDKEA